MCCFSRPVRSVSQTAIFARPLEDGRQVLAYAMHYRAAEPLALVLPVPVPDGTAESAVEWIDLQGCPRLFEQLGRAFGDKPSAISRSPKNTSANLKVARVGSFEASFAPTSEDLVRLDPHFTLPPEVIAALPEMKDRGFVIARLHPEATTIHPIGLIFPRRHPDHVFFPTLHVHDGTVHTLAHFDHAVYVQQTKAPANQPAARRALRRLGQTTLPGGIWDSIGSPLKEILDPATTNGLVIPDVPILRLRLVGQFANADLLV